MRKIERQMNEAVTNGLNWKSGNTSVTIDPSTNISSVYLHGNLIAHIGENYVQLFDGGWRTTTTKSRLNALCNAHAVQGEGVYQKQFEWYVRMYDTKAKEWRSEEFSNGILLA